MTMKRTNIYLTEKENKKLLALSKESGLSLAEIVRRAIDKYLRTTSNSKELS